MVQRSKWITVLLYLIGIGYGVSIILPLAWVVMLSLKTQLDAFAYPPLFIFKPTFEHYAAIFHDDVFVLAIRNSLIIALSSVFLSLLLAVPATFAIANLTGRRRRLPLLTILLIRMAPGMIYLLPYFAIYNRLKLLDTHIGLIIIYLIFNVPLIIWMLLPVWNSIPRELEEAAVIDGATLWQVLVRVDIPLVRIGIIASGILAFIFSWNEFLFALVVTRRETITLPVAIVRYMAYEGTEWGKISAAAVFIMVPVVIFGFLIRRYMISGLSAGAVKG
ncbi:MAG: carbohydrate ABC transporter permease [Caldilineaceae bacterium]|nr:carbohydrate ABC transporter permease [Caldilineaceae bacterium]